MNPDRSTIKYGQVAKQIYERLGDSNNITRQSAYVQRFWGNPVIFPCYMESCPDANPVSITMSTPYAPPISPMEWEFSPHHKPVLWYFISPMRAPSLPSEFSCWSPILFNSPPLFLFESPFIIRFTTQTFQSRDTILFLIWVMEFKSHPSQPPGSSSYTRVSWKTKKWNREIFQRYIFLENTL